MLVCMTKMGFYDAVMRSAIFLIYCLHLADAKPYPSIIDDQPLVLTTLLENGEIDKAKQLAEVKPIMGKEKSYAGFLTVNKTYDSNHFFWFFPATNSSDTAPVVVWLQGGPGASSLYGLFHENGPYDFEISNETLHQREYSWTNTLSMLYIDNPVGAGFSFTRQMQGYCRTEEDIAVNLHKTIEQFFQLFPEFSKNEFYVTGESYAGKYAPALAYAIHEGNKVSKSKINLKGVAIGDGIPDPFNMMGYGDYLNKLGLIDDYEKTQLDERRDLARRYIQAGEMIKALTVRTGTLDLFANFSGFDNFFNYLYSTGNYIKDRNVKFVQRRDIRSKIHVGNAIFNDGAVCNLYLRIDRMRSVAPWIEALLDNGYKFMTFNGQLDIIDAYPLNVEFLKNLNWKGSEEYKTTRRHIWKVQDDDEEVAGYVRIVRNLYEVLVRNAGHLVAADQPRRAYDLINRFVFNIPLF